MARINIKTATNVFFTEISLAVLLPYSIVYVKCYGDLNIGWNCGALDQKMHSERIQPADPALV